MLDLLGDGRPDLVVMSDACDAEIGKTRWDVYPGGATGFAPAPIPYAIPTPRCQTRFDSSSGNAGLDYGLLDLTGDGRPDLVVTYDDCEKTVGKARWDIYAGGPSGFGGVSPFAIPPARCQTPFDALARSTQVEFSLLALASPHPDLVLSRDNCDPSVGATHWDVYGWSAAGFSVTPAPYAVPAARCKARPRSPSFPIRATRPSAPITGTSIPCREAGFSQSRLRKERAARSNRRETIMHRIILTLGFIVTFPACSSPGSDGSGGSSRSTSGDTSSTGTATVGTGAGAWTGVALCFAAANDCSRAREVAKKLFPSGDERAKPWVAQLHPNCG